MSVNTTVLHFYFKLTIKHCTLNSNYIKEIHNIYDISSVENITNLGSNFDLSHDYNFGMSHLVFWIGTDIYFHLSLTFIPIKIHFIIPFLYIFQNGRNLKSFLLPIIHQIL